MGTCCYGNIPPEKFVGTWTDGQYVKLQIRENGHIEYVKQTEHTKLNYSGPTRYKKNSFFYCCCCCCLRGKLLDEDESESGSRLLTNKTVLKKV
ncbi:unnamed protein product [Adineta steineri]|uniref:Uncharacterized protein n=1 Tax=Adineta steineri TaxID=433720 RepID=A0A815RBR9_9BILA|nr:unnamed protein product [Adineta steineri]CAF1637031.1 unnamed protein product [Adineta steineri]